MNQDEALKMLVQIRDWVEADPHTYVFSKKDECPWKCSVAAAQIVHIAASIAATMSSI